MLETKNLTKYYGKKLGVNDMNITLNKGEALALLGINGSGKTTTFRMILNLLKPTKGSISYNGARIGELNKNICGYLPEERSLYKDLSVEKQLKFLASLHKMSQLETQWRISECLEELEIPHYRHKKIQELSKGNQQKIQLIAAILHQPQILILDEPFTGLDVENVGLFLKVIKRLKEAGVIMLISSHQLDYCEDICDHLIFLKQGEVKVQGAISALKDNYPGMYLSYSNRDFITLKENKEIILKEQHNNRFKYLIKNKQQINELAKALLSLPTTYELKMEQVGINDLIRV